MIYLKVLFLIFVKKNNLFEKANKLRAETESENLSPKFTAPYFTKNNLFGTV